MPVEIQGRRVQAKSLDEVWRVLEKAGDYCGPAVFYGGVLSVWYLLPIARDEGVPAEARCLHHVCKPPHQSFTEEPDGSLTIRESIGAGPSGGYYWHGFLTEGRWELNKSKK